MRVLLWATGADTGGQGYRIGKAFAEHAPDWRVDVHNNARHPLGYPEQQPLLPGKRLEAIRRLYPLADVVHLRNTLDGWRQLDRGACKPTVLHHHGSLFRTGHGPIAAQARVIGAVQIASTLDLALLEPDVEWLPAPYDLADLAAMRTLIDHGTIRIAHFPTSAKVKSTDAFMAVTASLAQRYPIEVISNVVRGKVRHMPWSEVLALKATADIYFDQLGLGYGNNAIEAWGMGIPVVAGTTDPKVREAMLARFGRLPFLEATEATLEATLERLIVSRAMREEYAAIGQEHVARFHDDAVVVAHLQGIYSAAPATRPVPLRRLSPWYEARLAARRAAA
jgi:hypothetical protein